MADMQSMNGAAEMVANALRARAMVAELACARDTARRLFERSEPWRLMQASSRMVNGDGQITLRERVYTHPVLGDLRGVVVQVRHMDDAPERVWVTTFDGALLCVAELVADALVGANVSAKPTQAEPDETLPAAYDLDHLADLVELSLSAIADAEHLNAEEQQAVGLISLAVKALLDAVHELNCDASFRPDHPRKPQVFMRLFDAANNLRYAGVELLG